MGLLGVSGWFRVSSQSLNDSTWILVSRQRVAMPPGVHPTLRAEKLPRRVGRPELPKMSQAGDVELGLLKSREEHYSQNPLMRSQPTSH